MDGLNEKVVEGSGRTDRRLDSARADEASSLVNWPMLPQGVGKDRGTACLHLRESLHLPKSHPPPLWP